MKKEAEEAQWAPGPLREFREAQILPCTESMSWVQWVLSVNVAAGSLLLLIFFLFAPTGHRKNILLKRFILEEAWKFDGRFFFLLKCNLM